MPSASKLIGRSPDACWRQFTDAATLLGWVPGLRKVRIVATLPDGLAREVAFEFSTSLTYSLVYRYDLEVRAMWWEPRMGQRDAVRGSARFDGEDGGTRVTYTTEEGLGRSAAERLVDDPHVLLDAFAQWMLRTREQPRAPAADLSADVVAVGDGDASG